MALELIYDGEAFFYFLLSFWTLLLLPTTYYLWPRKTSKEEKERLKKICQCIPCQVKRKRLNVNHTWIKAREKLMKTGLIIGWVIFLLLAFKVSKVQLLHVGYDPYAELEIDRGASQSEIKNAYRKLSHKFHPSKITGDERKFMRIAKAYAALTDNKSKRNWQEYGNPDGPQAELFGIALPKWIIEEGNSVRMLAIYGLTLMVIAPAVGLWWYKSVMFNKNQVLLDTTGLYNYFFQKYPIMNLKTVIMILAASYEFDKQHNSLIVERPSDNEELPLLIKMLPDLNEMIQEEPLCYTYSIKARALLHSQFHRIQLPRNTLEQDRLYILKKCPFLINEMIKIIPQLVASAVARCAIQNMPRLDTMENVMKVSPMIIQGVTAECSPLLQLPHITQDILRHFVTKKRNVQKISDLVTMKAVDRRILLHNLNDEEYQHVVNACRNLPQVKMTVKSKVLDLNDEVTSISAGSIMMVTVMLERKSIEEVFERQFKELEEQGSYSNQRYIERHEEDEEYDTNEGSVENERVKKEEAKFDRSTGGNEHANQSETPKRNENHPVHCPYFPEEKQEGWWLYVADKKNHMLISAPVQIISLKTTEEIQLKFSAPPKPGDYTYSVILRSDCYFDFDQVHNIKLDVTLH